MCRGDWQENKESKEGGFNRRSLVMSWIASLWWVVRGSGGGGSEKRRAIR